MNPWFVNGEGSKEETVYPIEREDYINAYTAAISEEMRQSRQNRQASKATPGALERLYGTVAGLLKRGAAGTQQPTNPLLSS